MNEFLQLKWEFTGDRSYLEKQACSFVPDEILSESCVYKHLKKRLPKIKECTMQTITIFFPGKKYQLKSARKSSLTKDQQKHCFLAIQLLKQNKNPSQLKQTEAYSLETFNKLHAKLTAENAQFIDLVKKNWENERILVARLQNNLHRYGCAAYYHKRQRYLDYGNSYKEEKLISMDYKENDNVTIDVNHIQNLLELGTVARFSQPSLKVECRLSAQTLPELQTNFKTNSKLPVSQDENIKKLLENNDIHVVISSSGLKRLLDNTDLKTKWTIPLIVQTINKDGKTKRVVFIDKPLVETHIDPIELKYYSMKRLVRTCFCQYEAFRYPQTDTHPNEKLAELNEKLQILEKQIDGDGCKGKGKKSEKPKSIIHHNAIYRLWKFKKTVNNHALMKNADKNTELNVLIRSKLDGCELISPSSVLQPVIIKPKIELQLEYGANVPTKSELSKEWTSLFFTPFSNLYRARMHWKTAEVVSMEKCTLQKINHEAKSLYGYNPYIGLGILNNLFNDLTELKPGNYLLVHLPKHESFVSVWSECEGAAGLNMNSEYEKFRIDADSRKNWVPIDLDYVLPIHEYEQRPPGCFLPYFKKGVGKKIAKKKDAGKGPKQQQQQNASVGEDEITF